MGNGYGHGQVSHQSVSKPYQGEHRSTTQSKAFGAHAAVVADAPNRLHGADAVVGHHAVHAPVHHAVHAVAHPVAHAVHAPVAHAVHAPVHHAVHAAPAYAAPVHAAPAYHAPVKAGYVADDLAEPSPYQYTYAVADDYSGAAFNQEEQNDGNGVVAGSYSVNLPDGRVQTVTYHANDYDGYVADVTYSGEPHYDAAPVAHGPAYHPAPAYHAAPVVAHPVAHAVHAAPVAVLHG